MSDDQPDQPTVNLPPEVASGAASPEDLGRDAPALHNLPTAIEERVLAEAIKRGLITAAQARSVVDDPTGPRRVTERLVRRGLIQERDARALEEEVTRTIVPGYVVERELGRGGMGVVYKARQTRLDRAVALKVVSPEGATDLDFLRRFELEAKALGRLNHPHIVQVYDCGEATGRLFIALEFVDGRDCQKEVQTEGPFPREKALQVIREAALGLRAAHQSGIIHRDVKPGNILLVRSPQGELTAKIADLGLALLSSTPDEGRLTRAGTVMGSPAYMAPEQSRAEAADHRSDIYSLGATLYHLLGGEPPFSKGGGSVLTILSRKLSVQLDPPTLTTGPIDEPLLRVLDRMLARRPEHRYQTWDEALADLDALLAGRAPATGRVEREFSSMKLEAGPSASSLRAANAPTAVRPPAAQAAGQPAVGPQASDFSRPPSSSRGPLLAGLVLLGVAAGAAFMFGPRDQGATGEGPGPVASAGGPVDLAQLSADEVAEGIAALERLEPGLRLSDPATVAILASKLATLPAGTQIGLRPRLRAAIDQALQADEPARLAQLERAWQAGEWQRLDAECRAAQEDYTRWEHTPPGRLQELAALAGRALTDGAGATEREVWAEAQAASDPLRRLALLGSFAERFPFSPALGEAARLLSEARAAAPTLTLESDPPGASLSVDGAAVGSAPWAGPVLRGPHEVRAELAGHVPLTLGLDVQGEIRRALVLGPAPARALVQDTERGRVFMRPNRFLKDWVIERGEWKVVSGGVWGDRADEPGDAPRGWSSVRRDLGELLTTLELDLAAGPFQLQWMLEPGAGAIAELRGFPAEDGRTVVFGQRGDELYFGLRGPGSSPLGGELELRASGRFGPQRPAGFFQLDWDGEVIVARTKQGLLGTLRLPWKPASACLQLAVEGGPATFSDLQIFGLRDPR